MNPLKALLTRLFQTTPIQDHDDPVLGVLRWRPSTDSWVSGPLPPDRRFHLEIARHKNGRAPPDDCVQVARDIAKDPVKLERGVRTQLVYEAQRRPPELRARIIDRWQEFEAKAAQPAIPQTLPDTLRLAAEWEGG